MNQWHTATERKNPMSDIIDKVKEILERDTYIDRHDGDDIAYEIFCDYRDELSDKSLSDISRADNPREAFDEIMTEWQLNAEDYYYPELIKTIRHGLEDEVYDEHEDEIIEWINDHVSWYLPEEHFNKDICVCIALDTGDGDSDFTQCNILNWYGANGYRDEDKPLSDTSPIRWLAGQQGKLEEVEKMISLELDSDVLKYNSERFSKFAISVIEELQNLPSHMACLTFLVKMPLFDYLKLTETTKGNVTLSKNTPCGLFDPWNGGGSLLEITLDKDVVLPVDKIWRVWLDCRGSKAGGYGWDVSDVYGLRSSYWTGTVTFESEETHHA